MSAALLDVAVREVRRGANWVAYRLPRRPARATAQPYLVEVTRLAARDPLSGRFTRRPIGEPVRTRAPRPRAASDLRITRRLIEWPEGEREVREVRVRVKSARLARLRGELRAPDLRSLERELGDELLHDANPGARAEWELEQMHGAHRCDKATRGAVSRRRNAAAQAAARPEAPAVQVSASIQVSRADLLQMLADLGDADLLTVRVRKYAGQPARLEAQASALNIQSITAV